MDARNEHRRRHRRPRVSSRSRTPPRRETASPRALQRRRPWVQRLLARDLPRTPRHDIHVRALRRPSRLPGVMPCHSDFDWLRRTRMLSEPSNARLRGRADAHGRRAHAWHEMPRGTTSSRAARDSHVWPRTHPASRMRHSAQRTTPAVRESRAAPHHASAPRTPPLTFDPHCTRQCTGVTTRAHLSALCGCFSNNHKAEHSPHIRTVSAL